MGGICTGQPGGLSALDHGILEIIQGNIPISGHTVFAVPAGNTWSVCFIHKRYGVTVFLLLTVGVFLFGGGYAQVVYVLLTLFVALHIDKPLKGWRRLLPAKLRQTIMGWCLPALCR